MTLAIILAVALLVGGLPGDATPATLEAKVRAVVHHEARQTRALAALGQLVDERRRYDEMVRRRVPEVQQLVANQRAARPAFEQLLGSFDADRVVATRRILDARARLRDALTADEWRAVFDS